MPPYHHGLISPLHTPPHEPMSPISASSPVLPLTPLTPMAPMGTMASVPHMEPLPAVQQPKHQYFVPCRTIQQHQQPQAMTCEPAYPPFMNQYASNGMGKPVEYMRAVPHAFATQAMYSPYY
ncbi:hypothetical protein BGZ54_001702 [Gamsiella multidivaricata]|nr:hypothetical protein BGZ54_001702 [Gamsiella multidivaricata]